MNEQRVDLDRNLGPSRHARYDVFPFVAASREKILDAVAQTAFTSLGVYGNCCRSTAWAIQVHLRRDAAPVLRACSVLAGGLCGTGETCGAVLGGLIAIGEALGAEDFRDLDSYEVANTGAREFLQRIRNVFGSTRCYDIQQSIMGWCCDDASKAEEWTKAGGPTACAGVCARAAREAATVVMERTTSDHGASM